MTMDGKARISRSHQPLQDSNLSRSVFIVAFLAREMLQGCKAAGIDTYSMLQRSKCLFLLLKINTLLEQATKNYVTTLKKHEANGLKVPEWRSRTPER